MTAPYLHAPYDRDRFGAIWVQWGGRKAPAVLGQLQRIRDRMRELDRREVGGRPDWAHYIRRGAIVSGREVEP